MNKNEKFATVINCMDGRVQLPVNKFMENKYKVDYLDTITEAGPNKILSEGKENGIISSIKDRYEVSTIKHKSKVVAIVGHFDCGGNPAGENEQIVQIKKSVDLVKSWDSEIEVIGLWVDENWIVNQL